MFKDEADFKNVVGRLHIDDEPRAEHREGLRREMLSAFSAASAGTAAPASGWRIVLRSPLVRLAAAAIVIAGVAIGAYRLSSPGRPDRGGPVAVEGNGTRPVHTGTPELAAIEIDLPRPVFDGTPQDRRVSNLERPLGRPRPPLIAPVGTTNVALGKTVSSGAGAPLSGGLEMITDGDKEATALGYVQLEPQAQYVTIDLEGLHQIWAVVVWHYHRKPLVYYDVVVQVSDDADFLVNVRTLFNNDADNSLGLGVGEDMHYTETYEGKLIDGRGAAARYVRLYSNGSTMGGFNHYTEVEVYGIALR